jgi:putative phosphoesterase
MLIACLSDIHGNLPALEAAVADAKARGASKVLCAGDMTGYGPFPDEVCRFLDAQRIPTIIGNYDQKVIEILKQGNAVSAGMKLKKREILLWAAHHLGKESQQYLSGLPESLTLQMGGHTLSVVHGSPLSTEDAIYPSITERGVRNKLRGLCPEILVCGHTHIPFVKRVGGILIVNCGSAGHPVDGDPRPAYALIRAEQGVKPQGRIVRFEYDRDRTIAALEKTSLPKGLRKDFAEGTKVRFLA